MKHLHHIATLTSVITLGVVIFNHTSNAYPEDGGAVQGIPVVNIAIPAESDNKPLNPNYFSNLHLFGQEVVARAKPAAIPKKIETNTEIVDLENLPDSKVKLDISGVLSASDDKGGFAIITDPEGKERSYRVGDELQQNISLHSIYKDYVVLMNNKKLEKLELPETKTDDGNKGNIFSKHVARGDRSKPKAFAARSPKDRHL